MFCCQHFGGPSGVLGYFHPVEWCLRLDRDLERLWWKLFILVNLDLSDLTRTTLASGQVGLSVTAVCGQDDDILCIQLSLSSSGGERVRGNTQFPGSRSSHGTPGLSPKVLPVIPGDSVTPGDSVRPVFTGQEAHKEKIDKRLDWSELPVLNSPSR